MNENSDEELVKLDTIGHLIDKLLVGDVELINTQDRLINCLRSHLRLSNKYDYFKKEIDDLYVLINNKKQELVEIQREIRRASGCQDDPPA